MDTGVVRVLSWFDKESEVLVGDAELVGLELTALQHLFGEWSEDPLYYLSYPVRGSHVKELAKYLPSQTHIDLECYEYFVDCYARDKP
jgi:hypothetical protein